MKVVILKSPKSKKWYWKIRARNGKTLATSETYSSKAMATKTWKKVADAICEGKIN